MEGSILIRTSSISEPLGDSQIWHYMHVPIDIVTKRNHMSLGMQELVEKITRTVYLDEPYSKVIIHHEVVPQ